MKAIRYIFLLVVLYSISFSMPLLAQRGLRMEGQQGNATQQSSSDDDEEDPCIDPDDARYCWTQDPITGIRFLQVPDTSHINLADRQTMEGRSLGLVHTGNLFSPHLVSNLFERRDAHDFFFVNAYSLFAYRPEDLLLYNTRIPFTSAAYSTSGSSRMTNDHLRINFAGNINRQLGLGTSFDYVYARGEYINEAAKPLKWTSYLYYDSDQYKATLSFNLTKLANQENGGIRNRGHVLNPDTVREQAFTDPHVMGVNLNNTWNDMNTKNLHFNHSYDLGMWQEHVNEEDSTDVWDEFVPVASIFHSVDFESMDHLFRMDQSAIQTDASGRHLFPHYPDPAYINQQVTYDSTSYFSFSTCAGIRLNEGFNKWSQFGLSAFIGWQHQEYRQMQDTLNLDYIQRTHATNNVFIGAQLSRHQSQKLYFDASARYWLHGDKMGDIDLTGHLQTTLPAGAKDSITVSASGYFRQQQPSFMLNHFFSNHFRWQNDFDPEKRLHLDGIFRYSLTGTEVKVGFDRISDLHYFSWADGLPHQHDAEIELWSAQLTQRLHWSIFHFDNTLLLQGVSKEDAKVMPLPTFVWQADLSMRFVIAHTLTTQLGCTSHLTGSYYAPNYQPATQQFCVQDEYKCGGFPILNAYVNCNLKRLKFYILYSGMTFNFRGRWTDFVTNDRFRMPFHPLQSTRLEYGVVFDLQN